MTDMLSPQDEEIIRRLGNLRDAGPEYPADLLIKRRTAFRSAAFGLGGAGLLAVIIKWLMRVFPNASQAAVQTGLEVVLVSALVVEAAATTFVYREPIMRWLGVGSANGSPTVTFSSGSSQTSQAGTENAILTSDATMSTTPTITGTLTSTPTSNGTLISTPTLNPPGSNQNPTPTNTTPSSPTPTTPTPTNPGHHYGQTKTPSPTSTPNPVNNSDQEQTPIPESTQEHHHSDH